LLASSLLSTGRSSFSARHLNRKMRPYTGLQDTLRCGDRFKTFSSAQLGAWHVPGCWCGMASAEAAAAADRARSARRHLRSYAALALPF
jgi:hypothetical protein